MVSLILLPAAVIVILVIAATSIKIIKPYEKGVVKRLGRYQKTVESGLRIIIPVFEILRRVDLRERVVDVPPQGVITKDNVVVEVNAIVCYEITDPVKVSYNIANFYAATTKLAQTNLRNLILSPEKRGDVRDEKALKM